MLLPRSRFHHPGRVGPDGDAVQARVVRRRHHAPLRVAHAIQVTRGPPVVHRAASVAHVRGTEPVNQIPPLSVTLPRQRSVRRRLGEYHHVTRTHRRLVRVLRRRFVPLDRGWAHEVALV